MFILGVEPEAPQRYGGVGLIGDGEDESEGVILRGGGGTMYNVLALLCYSSALVMHASSWRIKDKRNKCYQVGMGNSHEKGVEK